MFSFSKWIYLHKRYKLFSAGNKFPSFLILLFVNAKDSLVDVNHPLCSYPQVWLLIHFSLKYPSSFTSALFRTAARPWRPFTCPPKQMCMQYSPMTFLQLSLICWKWFTRVQFENHPQQVCLSVPCLLQELWQMVSTSTCQVWLQVTSLIPRVNGIAGLGAARLELVLVFCRTFLSLATCDLGLEIPWRCFFLVLS